VITSWESMQSPFCGKEWEDIPVTSPVKDYQLLKQDRCASFLEQNTSDEVFTGYGVESKEFVSLDVKDETAKLM
jgi:hypothetical protein